MLKFKWFHKKNQNTEMATQVEREREQVQESTQETQPEQTKEVKPKLNLLAYIEAEYVGTVLEYVYANKPVSLTLVSTVEPLKDSKDDCVVGISYDLKVMDTNNRKEILRIPTSWGNDSCFVSTIASWKRKNQLLFGTLLGQYLKATLEYWLYGNNVTCEIQVTEEIHINKALLYEKGKDNRTFTEEEN